jgi:hypothetical protein
MKVNQWKGYLWKPQLEAVIVKFSLETSKVTMTIMYKNLPVAVKVVIEILIALCTVCIRLTNNERAVFGYPFVCCHNLSLKISSNCEINLGFIHVRSIYHLHYIKLL